MIQPVKMDDGVIRYIGHHQDRPYIPATVEDNEYYDQESYKESLEQLDPLTRAQMRHGDWGASLEARFKAQWFANRRYHQRGELYVLGPTGTRGIARHEMMRIFQVIDPAASAREGPGDMDRYKKMDKSYTIIQTWGLTTEYNLILLDSLRLYVEAPDILKYAKAAFKRWRPQHVICESTGLGKAVCQMLSKAGLPVKAVFPHSDKINRATDALQRAAAGQIWLPEHPGPAWLKPLEDELFTWTGHPYETDDQIDCFSYAASDVSWEAAAEESQADEELQEALVNMESAPSVIGLPFSDTEDVIYARDDIPSYFDFM
jgi:predicted phage terminase large subunit-like protein